MPALLAGGAAKFKRSARNGLRLWGSILAFFGIGFGVGVGRYVAVIAGNDIAGSGAAAAASAVTAPAVIGAIRSVRRVGSAARSRPAPGIAAA